MATVVIEDENYFLWISKIKKEMSHNLRREFEPP
jgi:hypothetical protein